MTVFVRTPAQDKSLSSCLQALLATAYPEQALRIVPVIDRADAQACAIVKAYAHLFPERVLPCHRNSDASPHSALHQALPMAQGDLAVVMDTRQLPGTGLFKQLARPFFDPEVGLVIGGTKSRGSRPLTAVRLSAVEAAGGWDQGSLLEVDRLSQRLQAAGWSRVHNPEAVWVAHAPAPARPGAAQEPIAGEAFEPSRETPAPKTRATAVLMEHT
jgi:cellulose synthase/poly-beta-1,6-N-acetylglucosamine synthase-like glycosyltransferase